jgi:hypothetical protein
MEKYLDKKTTVYLCHDTNIICKTSKNPGSV